MQSGDHLSLERVPLLPPAAAAASAFATAPPAASASAGCGLALVPAPAAAAGWDGLGQLSELLSKFAQGLQGLQQGPATQHLEARGQESQRTAASTPLSPARQWPDRLQHPFLDGTRPGGTLSSCSLFNAVQCTCVPRSLHPARSPPAAMFGSPWTRNDRRAVAPCKLPSSPQVAWPAMCSSPSTSLSTKNLVINWLTMTEVRSGRHLGEAAGSPPEKGRAAGYTRVSL
jgi:hypothetical protein